MFEMDFWKYYKQLNEEVVPQISFPHLTFMSVDVKTHTAYAENAIAYSQDCYRNLSQPDLNEIKNKYDNVFGETAVMHLPKMLVTKMVVFMLPLSLLSY